MSLNNQDYVVTKGYLKKVVATAEKLNKNPEQQRMSLSIMETLFKHSTTTTLRLIEFGVLDHILLTCKRATDTPITLRHAALALANLSLYSCSEAKKKIIQKKVQVVPRTFIIAKFSCPTGCSCWRRSQTTSLGTTRAWLFAHWAAPKS